MTNLRSLQKNISGYGSGDVVPRILTPKQKYYSLPATSILREFVETNENFSKLFLRGSNILKQRVS